MKIRCLGVEGVQDRGLKLELPRFFGHLAWIYRWVLGVGGLY